MLIRISISPGAAPTATGSMRHACRRGRRAAAASAPATGCGSQATTRAPSRRNAAMRSPTCEPTSNTRSPGFTNRAIERVHRGAVALIAVIDAQRAHDAARVRVVVGHQCARAAPRPRSPAARAGAAAAGGAFSSGSAPMPARISARPTDGHEVIDRERDRQRGPGRDEQRVGDRRRHREGEHQDASTSRAACAARAAARASLHGTE